MSATAMGLFDIERTLHEMVDIWQEAQTPEAIEEAEQAIRVYIEAEVRKVDNIRKYVRFCDAQSAAAKAEAALQRSRQAVWEARADRLKQFVYDVMQSFRVKKLEGNTGSLAIKNNGGKLPLSIVSEELVPDEYCDMTVTMPLHLWKRFMELSGMSHMPGIEACFKTGPRIPSSILIRTVLEAGEGVPGCRLGERGSHLEVR